MMGYYFCLWHVIGFKNIIYMSYDIFEFTVLTICFPVKCELFHDGSTIHGYYIQNSLTVVYITCSYGLYCCSCCLSCYLGYGFIDICLFRCHYNLLVCLLGKYFLHFNTLCLPCVESCCMPSLDFYSSHHVVYLALLKIALVDAYFFIFIAM